MALKDAFASVGKVLVKRSPEILTGLGISGMIASTVLAVKATPKAVKIIEERKQAGGEVAKKEVVKLCWKNYIPSAVLTLSSVACLVGAASVNFRRNAALAAAYSVAETALATYKDKVVEVVGEKKEQEIRDFIHKDEVEANPVSSSEVIITEKGNTLCFDPLSGRYFRSDIEKIRKAVNELNKDMLNETYVSLTDFYWKIGLDSTPLSDENGWNVYKGLIDIQFSAQIADDGEPAIVLDYITPPRPGYVYMY